MNQPLEMAAHDDEQARIDAYFIAQARAMQNVMPSWERKMWEAAALKEPPAPKTAVQRRSWPLIVALFAGFLLGIVVMLIVR